MMKLYENENESYRTTGNCGLFTDIIYVMCNCRRMSYLMILNQHLRCSDCLKL